MKSTLALLLLTAILSKTFALTCEKGFYLDSASKECKACHRSCSDCKDNITCYTCASEFTIINNELGNCQSCPDGFFSKEGICQQCPQIEGCKRCLNESKCLVCKDKFFLSLDTYFCLEACPSQVSMQIKANGQQLCSKDGNLYVDQASKEPFELGTREFPFKFLSYSFVLFFNSQRNQNIEASVLIKKGKSMVFHQGVEPRLIVHGMKQMNLGTYQSTGEVTDQKPTLLLDFVQKPSLNDIASAYNVAEGAEYDFKFIAEETNDATLIGSGSQFSHLVNILYSNFKVEGIRFIELKVVSAWQPLFFGYQSAKDNWTQIQNCYFSTKESILQTYSGHQFSFEGNQVYIETKGLRQIAYFELWSQDCKKNTQNSIIFRKNIFEFSGGEKLSEFRITNTLGALNYTIEENQFLNFGQQESETVIEYTVIQDFNCKIEGTHKLIVKNNYFKGDNSNVTVNGYFAFNVKENVTLPGNYELEIQGNIFENLNQGSKLVSVKSTKPIQKLIFANNKFQNFKQISQEFLIQIDQTESTLEIQNNQLTDSKLNQFLNSNQAKVVVQNEQFFNVSQTKSSIQSFYKFVDVQNVEINGVRISNSEIQVGQLVNIQNTQSLKVTKMNISSTQLSYSLFKFNNVSSIEITEANFTQLYNLEQNTLPYFQVQKISLLTQNSSFKLRDSLFSNFQSSIIKVQDIQSHEEPQFQSFIQIQNSSFTGSQYSHSSFLFSDEKNLIKNSELIIQKCNFKQLDLPNAGILEGQQNIYYKISESLFEQNIGKIAVLNPKNTEFRSPQIQLQIISSKFLKNFGGNSAIFLVRTQASLFVDECEFFENFSNGFGAIAIVELDSSFVNVQKSKLSRNYAIQGSLMYLQLGAFGKISNSIIEENFANIGGVAYISSNSVFEMENSQLTNNFANYADIVYAISSENFSQILDSSIINENNKKLTHFSKLFQATQAMDQNKKGKESLFQTLNGNLRLSGKLSIKSQKVMIAQASSIFDLSSLSFDSLDIQVLAVLEESIMSFQSLNLVGLFVQDNYLIQTSSGSTIIGKDLKIQKSLGLLLSLDQSYLKIDQLEIKDHTLKNELKNIFKFTNSQVVISAFEINNFRSDFQSPFVDSQFSSIILSDSYFFQMNSSLIQLKKSSLELLRVSLDDFKTQNLTSAIIAYDSSMSFSAFSAKNLINLTAIKSMTSYQSSLASFLKIQDSEFSKISSSQGSAIYVENIDLEIKRSRFNENKATLEGGSIYHYCSSQRRQSCEFLIDQSNFENNYAGLKGGAISMNRIKFKGAENSFKNNVAKSGYGNDYAAQPDHLRVQERLEVVESGKKLKAEAFKVELVDFFENKVTLPTEAVVWAQVKQNEGSLSGISKVSIINGEAILDEFQVLAQPGSNVTLQIASSLFSETTKVLEVPFSVKQCSVGEIQRDNQCKTCQKGFFSKENSSDKCQVCPDHLHCPGGASIETKDGYWRPSQESFSVYECLNFESCLGGREQKCNIGYKGVLCGECSGKQENGDFYAKSGVFNCSKCESSKMRWLKLFGIIFGILLYVGFIVLIISTSVNSNQLNSVLLRILTNYFQIALFIKNMDIQWPHRVQSLIDYFSIIQSGTQSILQVSCFFQDGEMSSYFYSMILVFILPFALSAFFSVFWFALSRIKPSRFKETYKRSLVSTIFIFLYLFYPIISSTAFEGLNCIEIEDKKYLKVDLSVECWSKEHTPIALFLCIPAVLIYTIGVPLFVFVFLSKNKKRLEDKEIIIKFGQFYMGLRQETYYWELLISNLRKIAIVILTVSIQKENKDFQLLAVFSVLYLNHQLIKRLRPYKTEYINDIDIKSSAAALSTVILGIIFQKNGSSQAKNSIELEIVFWCLLLVNLYFICHWIFSFVKIYIEKVNLKIIEQNEKIDIKRLGQEKFQQRKMTKQQQNEKQKVKFKDYDSIHQLKYGAQMGFKVESLQEQVMKMEKGKRLNNQ